MSDGNWTNPSTTTEDLVENETTKKNDDEPMEPILAWGLVLASLASLLFCFIWIALVVIRRRKRRNVVPQGSARNSESPHDEATVFDEESLDEEKGRDEETF
jgi:hypothetical protein